MEEIFDIESLTVNWGNIIDNLDGGVVEQSVNDGYVYMSI